MGHGPDLQPAHAVLQQAGQRARAVGRQHRQVERRGSGRQLAEGLEAELSQRRGQPRVVGSPALAHGIAGGPRDDSSREARGPGSRRLHVGHLQVPLADHGLGQRSRARGGVGAAAGARSLPAAAARSARGPASAARPAASASVERAIARPPRSARQGRRRPIAPAAARPRRARPATCAGRRSRRRLRAPSGTTGRVEREQPVRDVLDRPRAGRRRRQREAEVRDQVGGVGSRRDRGQVLGGRPPAARPRGRTGPRRRPAARPPPPSRSGRRASPGDCRGPAPAPPAPATPRRGPGG